MSESEIVEITDSSINIIETSSIQDNGNNKRRLSEIDDEFESEKKKLCTDSEIEKLESTSSILEEPSIEEQSIKDESKTDEDTIVCLDNSTKLHTEELNTTDENESILDEIQQKEEEESPSKENDTSKIDESDDKNEGLTYVEDESNDQISDESEDEDDLDDDALMLRVNNSLPPLKKEISSMRETTCEPIALDSDTEEENENEDHSDATIEEEEDEEEDIDEDRNSEEEEDVDDENETQMRFQSDKISPKSALRMRLLSYNPRFYYARILVKKSVKYAWKKHSKKSKENDIKKSDKNESQEHEIVDTVTNTSNEKSTNNLNDQLPNEKQNNESEIEAAKCDVQEIADVEMKEVTNHAEIVNNEIKINTPIEDPKDEKNDAESASTEVIKENIDDTKSSQNNISNDFETHFLLKEIANCSVDEIMNKYVLHRNASEQSSTSQQQSQPPTLDEFSEELFFCLQQNKIEIQKAQQIWNEKVHIKFKIREVMERIRRHKAVIDIENFGFKPTQESQQGNSSTNILTSSKSSTTNSENEPYERSSKLTSESVNRLIQDVKANVLKKEQQQRMDFTSAININDSYDENSSFGLNPNLQNFGRQGQTIDVQSIINDFRQKNPQEIPRRGRRVKHSFESNFINESHSQFNKSGKSNHTMKSNSSGFPEVSLVPVNSFYKNSSLPTSVSPFGQKSSLLQSILTKQTTKNPIGYQQQSSTLQRLLTAPERSFQSVQNISSRQGHVNATTTGHNTKVHNNGEITITPIAGTSRKQEYSMDDEENSTEPPLVIDESEDYELGDRTRELICQGCRKNKALFMCAGCSRQWYCSKECQELAWNDHENSCF
ncbi:hypothetical protein PVAND_005578 [Polypedilum vanderplanki]|uniref:MYND-type domain-containing protein n=1 Tax=Polypedilum vanderplanki TaxID=319348 RepID=A0A9J6C2H1_POLVA|nr:hypothetical protein PVAND_005578 [Polypedilum vanderplanki]